MKELIRHRVQLLFENLQKADKEFFNAQDYLTAEDRELVLSITGGDTFTYKVSEYMNQFLSYSRQNRPDEDVNIYRSMLQDFYDGMKAYNANVFPVEGFVVDQPAKDIYDQADAIKTRKTALDYLSKLPKVVVRNLKHITQPTYQHKYQLEKVAQGLKSIGGFLLQISGQVDQEGYARIVQKTFNSKNLFTDLDQYHEKLQELLHVETFDMNKIDLQQIKKTVQMVSAEVIQEGEDFLLIAVDHADQLREISCAVHWCVTGESYFDVHTTVVDQMYILLQANSMVKNEDRLLLYTESDAMNYEDVQGVKERGMPDMEWYNVVNSVTYPHVDVDMDELEDRVREQTRENFEDYAERFADEEEEDYSMVAENVKRWLREGLEWNEENEEYDLDLQTISVDETMYHGTMEDRGSIPSLQMGYYDWDALWFTPQSYAAEEFCDWRGGEGKKIMWEVTIKSDKIVYIDYSEVDDIKEHFMVDDLREAIPQLAQMGFDGWKTTGVIDSTTYDDFAIWNEDVIDYHGVAVKGDDGEWSDFMSVSDAEELLSPEEIDEANPIIAMNDISKGHVEFKIGVVS